MISFLKNLKNLIKCDSMKKKYLSDENNLLVISEEDKEKMIFAWFVHLKESDYELYSFLKESLDRGYGYNSISKELISLIIEVLGNEQDLDYVKKYMAYITNQKGFKTPRINYELNNIRYSVIMKYVGNWIHSNQIILDIGCGHGDFAPLLLKNNIKKYIGSDIYLPDDLDLDLLNNDKVVFLNQKSDVDVDIENNSVDVILMVDILHHVPMIKQSKFLCNIKNKLAKNGKLIIFEYLLQKITLLYWIIGQ